MNVLITGGAGFLGYNLIQSFIKDRDRKINQIYMIVRRKRPDWLTNIPVQIISCDLADIDKLQNCFPDKIDLVLHLAGKISIAKEDDCINELIKDNLISTVNLIQAMIKKKAKKLIFTSSMTVYGINNKIPVKENGKLEPIHFYGLTKKWAEETIQYYSEKGLIRSLILRLPGLYGGLRNSGYIYNMVRNMSKNQDIEINTKGLKFWEAMNVDDAVKIIKEVLGVYKWKKNYEILNCSYGEEIDFIETAYRIRRLLNSKSKIKIVKPLDYKKFYLDNSKLRKLIDFDYSFEEGLENYIKHYLC